MSTAVVYDATPAEKRSRVTIFFRGILWIPHYFALLIYGLGAGIAVIIAWFALLFTGRYPEGLYSFVAKVAGYQARLNGYITLLVDQYPPFDLGEHPEYPVRLIIGPPQASYSRAKVFFRGLLIIPVAIINYVLLLVGGVVTVLVWILGVIVGSTPEGLSNALVFTNSYSARAAAYGVLLTEDWPQISQDPGAVAAPTATGSFAPSSSSVTPPPPPPPPAANPFGE